MIAFTRRAIFLIMLVKASLDKVFSFLIILSAISVTHSSPDSQLEEDFCNAPSSKCGCVRYDAEDFR